MAPRIRDMTNRNHGRFHSELALVAETHPDPTDRFLIRSALMWLSVARRPLRAYELWIALQVEESKDVQHIESLLTTGAYVDEHKAVSSLRRLLGGLISTQDAAPGSGRGGVFVSLYSPEISAYLFRLDELDSPETDTLLAFSPAQAHILAASVSMAICSVTTMHLAHVHDDTTASSLVLYSWTHWGEHLFRSGYSLANNNAAGLADSMIFRVCTDLLVLLLALNDFVTGPITFSIMHDQARCAALVRHAQEALDRPLSLLSTIGPDGEYCRALQSARHILDTSKQLRRSRGRSPLPSASAYSTPVSSRIQTLRMDRLAAATGHLLGDGEKQTMRDFSDLARGLRSVSLVFAQAPLYEELLKEYRGDWSPLDILVNAANWAEAVASYPFWEELSGSTPSNPMIVDPNDNAHYGTASLVLSQVRKDAALTTRDEEDPFGCPLARAPPIPPSISAPRWAAASVIYNIKGLRSWLRPTGTFTINHPRFLARRASSFSRFPLRMQTGSGSPFWANLNLRPFIPANLRHLYRRRVSTFLTRVTSSDVLKTLDDFSSGSFSSGLADTFPQLKTALLSDGYRSAVACLVAAIMLHHLRRMFTPWLGSYVWYTPLEDLRIALSNPDYFLEGILDTPWVVLVCSQVQKPALDTLANLTLRYLTTTTPSSSTITSSYSHPQRDSHPRAQKNMESSLPMILKIMYLTWVLATLEYILTRALYTTSFLLSPLLLTLTSTCPSASSTFNPHPGFLALFTLLNAHWTKVPVLIFHTWTYTRYGLWPLTVGSIVCALAGQPGLLLLFGSVAGGVTILLKYRSTFYIAMEVSGLFVTLGFFIIGVALMGRELVRDPIGLKASTAVARRRGIQARSVLPRGAGEREGILRGERRR